MFTVPSKGWKISHILTYHQYLCVHDLAICTVQHNLKNVLHNFEIARAQFTNY